MVGFSRKEGVMLVSGGAQQNAPKKGSFRAALLASKSGREEGGWDGHCCSLGCHAPPLLVIARLDRAIQ
jgi:hypothetical protein